MCKLPSFLAACFALCGAALLGMAPAQAQSYPPGEYISGNGLGTLKVEPATGNRQKFSLESWGANGHSCSLDGEIVARVARLSTDDANKEPPCVVGFNPKGTGIDVAPKGEGSACRSFCGMRASFEGTYLKPAPGCTNAEMTRTRTRFKQAYDRKDYALARQLLAPLLKTCAETLSELQGADIRNDLAVTLHHLNEDAACREVLEPLRELARMSKDELNKNFPPADAEARAPVARAARTNLRLCGAGAK
jgi:hypothetical protein